MIGFKVYRSTPTTLDLNGPILSYTQQPVGLTTDSSTINLVGIATALPVGTGSISYQWYETGHGPIATSSTITGTATTTLTLNELNYNDSGREFYLEAGYNPSAYGTSDPITAGTARSTGNAVNAPLVSDTAEITVGPTIVILQQPVSATTVVGQEQNFSVLASIGSSTGAGIPSPCIAVRAQSDGGTQALINEDWTTFRNRWPSRPFNIFRVPKNDGSPSSVILPSVAPTDYNVENVVRDDGNVGAASDWFNLANLGDYPRGITVTLTIDVSQPNTGMTFSNVAASYNKFVEDCAEAGIIIEYSDGIMATAFDGVAADGTPYFATTPGRYIYPFIYKLVGSDADPGDPNLFYQWKVDGENPVNYNRGGNEVRQVENASTRVMTITQSPAGIHTVACSVSYEGANNSPLLSNVVNFDVVADTTPRSVLHLEEFDVNATLYNTKVVNLEDEALEIIPSNSLSPTSNWNRIYSINAPEKDVTVKITMKAASGGSGFADPQSSINYLLSGEAQGTDPWTYTGGEGGVSVWTMTLTKQQEYVVNLGARLWPSGGFGERINSTIQAQSGTGGGGSFFYEGGQLLVACGGGGGSGYSAGFNWANKGTSGYGGGIGPDPNLTSIGEFAGGLSSPSAIDNQGLRGNTGGRVARCTIGSYWATQGIAPCGSIGSTQVFTGKDGQESTSIFTTPVIRGYKAGLNYQFNGGNGMNAGCAGGGGGAQGGRGGIPNSLGGEGGLGFAAIPIDSATVGGHNGLVGTIKIEKV